MGLMPIMWSMGTGADVMKRVAAPMVGGLTTSFIMELLVYPAIYFLWKKNTDLKHTLQADNFLMKGRDYGVTVQQNGSTGLCCLRETDTRQVR